MGRFCWDGFFAAVFCGGDGSRVALDLAGHQLTYRELENLVAAHRRHLSGPVRCDPAAPPTQILTSLLAAVQAGVSWYLGPTGVLPGFDEPGAGDGAGDRGPVHAEPAGNGGPWLYLATSGTTSGRGRVIRRTWQSWHTSVGPLAELTGTGPDDVVYLSGPLSGTMHLFAAVHTLAIGAQLTDQPAAATATHCTPSALRTLLADRPPKLRTVIVAGDRLPEQVRQAAELSAIAVTEYYGAAELSFVAARRPHAAAMTAFPGVSLRIVDGLLWAKSPYLATGYAAGQGSWRQDADGYVTVGDHAQWRDFGPNGTALSILGRDSTAVTVGGVTILVEEVESVLTRLPGVRAAAIVGIPHPRLGATLLAIVETEPEANPTAIRVAARTELCGAYLPRRFVRTTALPRNASGKIARDTLRRGVLDGSYPLHGL